MTFSKRQSFFLASIFFLTGIFLQNISFSFPLTLLFWSGIFILCINAWIYLKFSRIFFGIWIIFFLFGGEISLLATQKISDNSLFIERYLVDSPYEIHYVLEDVYKENDLFTDYIAHLMIIDRREVKDKNILLLVRIPSNYRFPLGQELSSQTKIRAIQNFSTGDIQDFFLSKDIYFRAYPYTFLREELYQRSPANKLSDILRERITGSIEYLYPLNSGSLLWWLLIGARSSISPELNQDFNRSGLSHIVAVSGFNITILIFFVSIILIFFPRVIQLFWVVWFWICFVLLVGASMSVLRAAIMGLIGYFVVFFGRKVDNIAILLVSLSIIVFFSPLSLNYDISLQLSFLATLGIILFSKPLKKVFAWCPEMLFVKETLIMTFAAMIFNIPIMLWNFGQLSVVAPVTNILVVWNIPLVMLLWFLSLVVNTFSTFGGLFFAYFTHLLLMFDMSVVTFFWSQSWSVLPVELWDGKWVFYGGYYIIIFYLFWCIS